MGDKLLIPPSRVYQKPRTKTNPAFTYCCSVKTLPVSVAFHLSLQPSIFAALPFIAHERKQTAGMLEEGNSKSAHRARKQTDSENARHLAIRGTLQEVTARIQAGSSIRAVCLFPLLSAFC